MTIKPGVYLNKFKDRGDLIIIHNENTLPETGDKLTLDCLNFTARFEDYNTLLIEYSDLEYLGDL